MSSFIFVIVCGLFEWNQISIKNFKKIRPCHMTLEIQVLVWDRHTYVAGLNRLMRSLPSSPVIITV
jgi:hypothetical protein